MTKQEAADALFISPRTLDRRMKDGTYKFTKTADGKVSFTHADLGLPESVVTPPKEIPLPYQDEPAPARKPAMRAHKPFPIKQKTADDLKFAEAYLSGEATDSYGNKVDGTNARCPTSGPQCGVTKPAVTESAPQDTQSHMDNVNLSDRDHTGAMIDPSIKMGTREYEEARGRLPKTERRTTRHGVALAEGMTQAQYDAMMYTWDRTQGMPSMAEQTEKILRDKKAISDSFSMGGLKK